MIPFNLSENIEYCKEFVNEASSLINYTHLISISFSLIFGFLILIKGKKDLITKIVFLFLTTFSLWIISNISIWYGYDNTSLLVASWSLIEFLNVSLYAESFLIIYLFLNPKKNYYPPLILSLFFILTTIIPVALGFYVNYYDSVECVVNENIYYVNYVNILKGFFVILNLFFIIKDLVLKKENRFFATILGIGMLFFLFSFGISGYISYITDNFKIELLGLLAMPVFIGALSYLIIKFKTFSIRFITSQILVIFLFLIVFAKFFYSKDSINTIDIAINVMTLFLVYLLGRNLIISVKKVDEQKEALEIANHEQEALMHFITHQIKGFLTKSKGIFSMAVDGDLGPISPDAKKFFEEGLDSDTRGVNTVQDLLNASNMKTGAMTFNDAPTELSLIAREVFTESKSLADKKSLVFEFEANDQINYMGDMLQFRNVFKNLIENAIHYTPTGSVKISLKKLADKIRFEVTDTGIGIDDEDKKRLFTEGGRGKESVKVNVNSTGYGLFIAKKIVDHYKGKIWAESEGQGKGAKFVVELPLTN